MKKIIGLLFVLALLLAVASPAFAAVESQAGSIKITAQEVDYVSALAGIAKPVTKTHAENERFAVLVSIKVPSWFDTTNMAAKLDRVGLTVDGAFTLPIVTGDYIIYGTLYSANASLTITLEDNAINSASSAQELWRALYGDRSVSAVVNFAPQTVLPQATMQQTTTNGIQTVMIAEVPQTGGAPATAAAVAIIAAAFLFIVLRAAERRRRTK